MLFLNPSYLGSTQLNGKFTFTGRFVFALIWIAHPLSYFHVLVPTFIHRILWQNKCIKSSSGNDGPISKDEMRNCSDVIAICKQIIQKLDHYQLIAMRPKFPRDITSFFITGNISINSLFPRLCSVHLTHNRAHFSPSTSKIVGMKPMETTNSCLT